jgi:hypothetical protein
MSEMVCKEVDKINIPFTREQLGWILTHMKLTRKGKKLAKQLRRCIWQKQ